MGFRASMPSKVFCFVGKQGGGKSYLATDIILGELVRGKRNVVTNVSLKLQEISDVLHHNGLSAWSVMNRVYKLGYEEQWLFWRYRGPGHVIVPDEVKVNRDGHIITSVRLPDQLPSDPGTLFVIDEANIVLSSHQWKMLGVEGELYLQQVRRHGDCLILLTHSEKNIDRFCRDQVQEWWYLRNFGREKHRGFALPKKFWVAKYQEMRSNLSMMNGEELFSFDLEVGGCYDTRVGVGATGGRSDLDERRGGIHWSFAVAALVLFLVGSCWGVYKLFTGFAHHNDRKILSSLPSMSAVSNRFAFAGSVAVGNSVSPIQLTGWARAENRYRWFLTDGTVLENPKAVWDGQTLRLSTGQQFSMYKPTLRELTDRAREFLAARSQEKGVTF